MTKKEVHMLQKFLSEYFQGSVYKYTPVLLAEKGEFKVGLVSKHSGELLKTRIEIREILEKK